MPAHDGLDRRQSPGLQELPDALVLFGRQALEAREFMLQPSIVRGTFAYWARRAGGI